VYRLVRDWTRGDAVTQEPRNPLGFGRDLRTTRACFSLSVIVTYFYFMNMRNLNLHRFSFLLLAAALGIAAAGRQGGMLGDGKMPQGDKPIMGFPDGQGGKYTLEGVTQKLTRTEAKLKQFQSQFSVQNSQQAAPLMAAIQDQLAKAHEFLAAGNYQAADIACDAVDAHIGEMFSILNNNAMNQNLYGGKTGIGADSERVKEDLKNGAQIDIQRDDARLANFAQLLAVSKNPRAADMLDKVRTLLEGARGEIAANRPAGARLYLSQVEPLFYELQRLLQENHASEIQPVPDASRDAYKDLQPGVRVALGQASEIYRRVQDRATRVNEQTKSTDDPKAAAANARIQDLLDKAKEALNAGQAEAAKEYGLKAEGLLAELHRSVSASDARLSPAAWQRLKAKLDRAAEIVAASGNDKASKILEKGQEHLERAQRSQAEGQAARAEVEMDLALKLAAKAVDIARSGPR